MGERHVCIAGFPVHLNTIKLRLFVEKHSGSGSVENVQRKEDHVIFTFRKPSGLQEYLNANIKEYMFGTEAHHIEIVNCSDTTDDSKPSMVDTAPMADTASMMDTASMATFTSPIKPLDPSSQEYLFKNIQYSNLLPNLPAARGTQCVLVQGIDDAASLQKVKMYFELKRRANGGPISGIIRMIDGLLIIFQNAEDCESCLKKNDQVLEGKQLTIFPKVIPTSHERMFAVEGVGAHTSKETLELFLENCSSIEATPSQCIQQDIPEIYLVKYGPEIDSSEIPIILQNIQSKPLEGRDIKARLLLRTDCLKLTNVKDTITNDQIKYTLQSKKRTGGGPITRIDRTQQQSALVYFSLFTDAERVCENAKHSNGEIIIAQHPIHIQLYHHCLGKDHENIITEVDIVKKQKEPPEDVQKPLRPFQYKPMCNQLLLNFIYNSAKHQPLIKGYFKRFAAIEFNYLEEEESFMLRFASKKEHSTMTQEVFENKCVKNFEELMSDKYVVEEKAFDQQQLDFARLHNLSQEIQEAYTGDNSNGDFIVRWDPDNPTVRLIGLKQPALKMVSKMEACLKYKATTKEFSEDQFNILVSFGVLDEIQQANDNKIKVIKDENKCTVTLIGLHNDVLSAFLEVYDIVGNFKRRQLTGINESVKAFLTESMQISSVISKTLQGEFASANVKATIIFDAGEPYVQAKSDEDFHKAIEIVNKNVVKKLTKLDQRKSDALTFTEWDDFKNSLQNTGQFGIYIKENDHVAVVGLKSEVENVRRKIELYLHENTLQTFFLQTLYGKARFILEFSVEFTKHECQRKNLVCALSPEAGGGICLEGKRAALQRGHQQLVTLEKNVIEFPVALTNPGIEDFYNSEDGKSFLMTLQRVHSCVILVNSTECEEWAKQSKKKRRSSKKGRKGGSPVDSDRKSLIEVTLPKTNVKLKVWKTNITQHKCDVIVNASNEDLILLPSGISGAIHEFDKNNLGRIQQEMRDIIDKNYGKVNPGVAVLTSSGNLPNCKAIVHAVGPRWQSHRSAKNKLTLKSCIAQALDAADQARHKSIAIPAISCGVFGGKVSVCVPLIVEAVAEFFNERAHRSIKEVHFVEFSLQDVLDEFVSALNKYQKSPSESQIPQAISSSSLSSLINIVQGDIAIQKGDVIVNPTDPNHLCHMNKGPVISQVLAKKAGAKVVQECANLKGPFNVGSVHETSGGGLSCKKIYHAVVTQYNPKNSTSVLQSVISECLRRADAANYSSIVFPAIATGGFKHPADFVAKVMKQVINGFQLKSLKEISIVLFPGNPDVITAFNTEFNRKDEEEQQASAAVIQYAFEEHKEKRPQKMSPIKSSFQKVDEFTGSVGSLVMSICEGDITEMNGDVIVNSTNQEFKLNQGMVSKKILEIGGQQIQYEASKKADSEADFIITNAGNLPCKKVVHLVTPTNPEDLHLKIVKVLNEVENMKLKSVYMPAFGTGMLNLEVDTIASIMRASIEEFAKSSRLLSLEFVSIVIYDKRLLPKFKHGFFHPEKKQGMLGRLISNFKNLFYTNQASADPSTSRSHRLDSEDREDENDFHLFLYSNSEDNINKAVHDIHKEADRRTLKQVIQDQVITRLTEWERYEIQEITKRHKTVLTQKNSRYLGIQLILEGAASEVLKAQDEIQEIIREFGTAETCATYIIWQHKSKSDQWEDLSPRSNYDLEQAYQTWSHNLSSARNLVQVRYFKEGKVTMKDFDLADTLPSASDPQICRRIREKHISDLPVFWEDMQSKQLKLVTLITTCQEYQNVLQKFTGTSQFFQAIVSIQRVQNVQLYKQYTAKKTEIAHKLKGFPKPIEHQLFHGTSDDDKICQHGFDRSYAGKNAIVYGRGVYFAVDPAYSHRYAAPNANGERRIFLADVITGEFCVGNQNITAPPPKPNSSVHNDIYDSLVDNAANPQIFVIFKDASAYPTYLITYQ